MLVFFGDGMTLLVFLGFAKDAHGQHELVSFLLRRDIPSSAKCFELTGAVCYAIALVFFMLTLLE